MVNRKMSMGEFVHGIRTKEAVAAASQEAEQATSVFLNRHQERTATLSKHFNSTTHGGKAHITVTNEKLEVYEPKVAFRDGGADVSLVTHSEATRMGIPWAKLADGGIMQSMGAVAKPLGRVIHPELLLFTLAPGTAQETAYRLTASSMVFVVADMPDANGSPPLFSWLLGAPHDHHVGGFVDHMAREFEGGYGGHVLPGAYRWRPRFQGKGDTETMFSVPLRTNRGPGMAAAGATSATVPNQDCMDAEVEEICEQAHVSLTGLIPYMENTMEQGTAAPSTEPAIAPHPQLVDNGADVTLVSVASAQEMGLTMAPVSTQLGAIFVVHGQRGSEGMGGRHIVVEGEREVHSAAALAARLVAPS